jgi:hypothetical protein
MNGRRVIMWVVLALLCAVIPVRAFPALEEVRYDFKSFFLERDGKLYNLRSDDGFKLTIPATWLDEDTFGHYHRQVTAFPIGDGRIGLHLSSYEFQIGETAQAAEGRDVFLLLDPKAGALRPGGPKLGVTKERSSVEGRVSATAHSFFIGDVNGDHLLDLGVIKEEIVWKRQFRGPQDREALAGSAGPVYVRQPIRWYVLSADRWTHQADYDGKFPSGEYQKLPLIGLVKSPVDFVDEAIYPGIRKGSNRDISRPY